VIGKQEQIHQLMKDILKENYLHLEVLSYELSENFVTGDSRIVCQVKDSRSGEVLTIEGRGSGVLDAFFHGLKDRLAKSFPSLNTIRFSTFELHGEMETSRDEAGTDAEAVVTLGVKNSQGREFEFQHTSRSILRSGIEATLDAAEYFVNSEKAFLTVHAALAEARRKGRSDLVEKYTNILAVLVENTSYSEVIEQRKRELEGKK
jgi:hypothetical protein